jgi:hypothetical protein
MSKLLFIVVMIVGLAFFGCGEQADQADNGGDNGGTVADSNGDDAHGDDGDHEVVSIEGFDMDTPEMAVGQWIEYNADNITETVTISVVGTETNQGTECYWVQISAPDFIGQVLVDPEGMNIAMGDYKEQFGTFTADPAAYLRENMSDTGGMAEMFGSEENMGTAIELISAVRMIKIEQQGTVMAIDLAGVPEFLEGMMDDPAFKEQFQQGFAQGFEAESGQEGLDEIMSELDKMEFGMTETDVDVAGNTLHGMEFTIVHPEGEAEVIFSSELPLLPIAYAKVTGDGETHFVEVKGYGFSGAENLLPGEPAQTIQAMMFLQGMQSQMGAMGGQGRGMN